MSDSKSISSCSTYPIRRLVRLVRGRPLNRVEPFCVEGKGRRDSFGYLVSFLFGCVEVYLSVAEVLGLSFFLEKIRLDSGLTSILAMLAVLPPSTDRREVFPLPEGPWRRWGVGGGNVKCSENKVQCSAVSCLIMRQRSTSLISTSIKSSELLVIFLSSSVYRKPTNDMSSLKESKKKLKKGIKRTIMARTSPGRTLPVKSYRILGRG